MNNRPLKLGFIGGGINSAVGETHFIAAQMDDLFGVEAGCFSKQPEINRQTAQRRHIAEERLYATWKAMLEAEQDRLDAVVVLTPTPEHTPVVLAALEQGLAVICEKALAVSSHDARLIEQSLAEHAGTLFVTYNYTGYPMLRELRAIIHDGRIGRIEQIHIEMPQEGFARLNRDGEPMIPQQWRLRDGALPTISLDLGVHLHHIVDFLTGARPLEVVASQASLGQFRQVIDNINAIVHYTDGIECGMWYSKAALGHRNGLRVRVYGELGAAEWFQMDPERLLLHDNRGHTTHLDRACIDVKLAHLPRYNRFKAGHPAGFMAAFANLYADIASCLRGGTPEQGGAVFSAPHAREGLVLLEALATSARERRWVAIDDMV